MVDDGDDGNDETARHLRVGRGVRRTTVYTLLLGDKPCRLASLGAREVVAAARWRPVHPGRDAKVCVSSRATVLLCRLRVEPAGQRLFGSA